MDAATIRPLPADAGERCQKCNSPGELMNVTFRQNVGAVVVRFSKELKGDLCAPCIRSTFWSCTLLTLVVGWWGMISFVVTPIFLIGNLVNLASASRLAGWRHFFLGLGTVLAVPTLLVVLIAANMSSPSPRRNQRYPMRPAPACEVRFAASTARPAPQG
jgi:hypothetical protein